ncbi:TonB-dependent siderophore receptor [Rhodoplanes azumiensis]|uniref:TonB-dependent siderophore receptor n=1 Tax=Rhodoplanes azumiensis TaxID=1897628 RepID=A0ABW5AM72_9BRAD
MTHTTSTGGSARIVGLLLATTMLTGTVATGAFAQSTALPTIRVESDRETGGSGGGEATAPGAGGAGGTVTATRGVAATSASAVGPVEGYVADRSMTGTKTNTPVVETPESVSIVTRDQMEDQQAQSVSQALRYTPGVLTDLRPASRFDIIPVRGYGGNLGVLQGFVGFQDGLKLQRGISFAVPTVDPYTLERIEVLRGPSSILYGQTNLGGMINLVTKRPLDKPFHEVQVTGGNFERLQGTFDVSGPIDKDGRWLYRLTGLARNSGTQVDYTEDDRYVLAPALTWKPSSDTTWTLLANHTQDPNSFYSVFLPKEGTVMPSRSGWIASTFNVSDPGYEVFERKQTSLTSLFEHRFDDVWTIRQNTRVMHLETNFRGLSPTSYADAAQSIINRAKSNVKDELDSLAMDNQVQAQFYTGAFKHTVLMGLDYQYADASRLLGNATTGVATINFLSPMYWQSIPVPAYQTDAKQTNDQLGLYIQDQIRLGNLIGMFGLRRDRASFDFDQITIASGALTSASQTDAATTWRAGLLYHFENGLAPYISYSTSFEPVTGSTLDYYKRPFKPTTGEQVEAGIKYQPPGTNMLFTAAVYELTQYNVQTPDTDPTHKGCGTTASSSCSVQTGAVRTRGVELEAKASINRNIDVLGAFTWQDMEVTQANDTSLGKRPVQVPEYFGSVWGMYTFRDGPAAGLGLGAGVRHVSSTFGDVANTIEVPAFTLVDAAVHFDFDTIEPKLKGLRLSLNASNLFDKEYVASCSAGSGSFDTGCYFGTRRTILATARYRW